MPQHMATHPPLINNVMPYHIKLDCTPLHVVISYNDMSYHVASYHIVSYDIVLSYAISAEASADIHETFSRRGVLRKLRPLAHDLLA